MKEFATIQFPAELVKAIKLGRNQCDVIAERDEGGNLTNVQCDLRNNKRTIHGCRIIDDSHRLTGCPFRNNDKKTPYDMQRLKENLGIEIIED